MSIHPLAPASRPPSHVPLGVRAQGPGDSFPPELVKSTLQSPHASNRIHGFARFHALTFLAILGLSALVSISPSVAAQVCEASEDFEAYAVFTEPDGCFYTYSVTSGTSAYVSTTNPFEGNKSLRMDGTATRFNFDTEAQCGPDGGATISFDIYVTNVSLQAFTVSNGAFSLSNGANVGALSIATTGVTTYNFDGVSTVVSGLTWTSAEWYNVVLSFACTTGTNNDVGNVFITDSAEVVYQAVVTGREIDTDFQRIDFGIGGPTQVFVDNLETTYPITGSNPPGVIFCADPSLGAAADWGYDYKEDTTFDESLTGFDLDDGFVMVGNDGDQSYLGKAFTPGTQAIRQVARLEADADATDSIVRLAFTTGAGTLSDGASGDGAGDMTLAGNGQNTGNFEDQIQAVLQENGGQWIVSIKYTEAGGALTQILGSANYGANPNTPHTFSFIVNTGTTTITGPLVDAQNHTIFTGSIAPGKAQLRGEAGTIIERDVPAGLGSAEWKDSWVVTTGSSGVLIATTILDDNTDAGQTDDSTCIFDLLGTATVVGSSGSSPGSFIVVPDQAETGCTAIFCPPAEGVGGISASALSLFLGIVIVASFAASMSQKTGSGAAGIAIFALLGLFIAYALGYIQLWVIVSLTVMGVAAIFLGIRNGSQGTGM